MGVPKLQSVPEDYLSLLQEDAIQWYIFGPTGWQARARVNETVLFYNETGITMVIKEIKRFRNIDECLEEIPVYLINPKANSPNYIKKWFNGKFRDSQVLAFRIQKNSTQYDLETVKRLYSEISGRGKTLVLYREATKQKTLKLY